MPFIRDTSLCCDEVSELSALQRSGYPSVTLRHYENWPSFPYELELFSLSTSNMTEHFEGFREGRAYLGDLSFVSEEIAGLKGSCLHTMELGSLLRR